MPNIPISFICIWTVCIYHMIFWLLLFFVYIYTCCNALCYILRCKQDKQVQPCVSMKNAALLCDIWASMPLFC